MSIIFIMAAYRFFILYYQIYEYTFIFVTMAIYLSILILGFKYHCYTLKMGYYSSKYKGKSSYYIIPISIASVCGLWIGRTFIKNAKDDQSLMVAVLTVLLLIMGYMFEIGMHYFYKYYLIKKYRSNYGGK